MTETTSILDADKHQRIIEDLPQVLRDAGISEPFIHTNLARHASPAVVDFVVKWPHHRREGTYGLLVTNPKHMPSPEAGMSAVVAALVRNFIRARVVTLQGFMEDDEDLSEITCLAVPNLLVGSKSVLPEWMFATLSDKLLHRKLRGRLTLFYAPTLKDVETVYGTDFARTLKRDFVILE